MEDFPSGSHVLLKGKCEGCVLYFLGYKYNCRKVLCFLCSENSGDFKEGLPYVARFHDTNGNMQNREVYRPSIISDYFGLSNKIDRHNHIRQSALSLEKYWVTQCPWFRIATTVIGMTVTDASLLTKLQSRNTKLQAMTVVGFSDRIAFDLINNNANIYAPHDFIPSVSFVPTLRLPSPSQGYSLISPTSLSTITNDSSVRVPLTHKHELALNPEKAKCGRTMRRQCNICKKKIGWVCMHPTCRESMFFFCKGDCWNRHLLDTRTIGDGVEN